MKSDIKIFNCGLWYNGKMHKGIYYAGMLHDALYAQGYIDDNGIANYRKIWKEVDWTFRFEVTGTAADGTSWRTPVWARLIEDGLVIYNNGEVQNVGKSASATLSCKTLTEAQNSAKKGAGTYGADPARKTWGIFIGILHQTETVAYPNSSAIWPYVRHVGAAGMAGSAYLTNNVLYEGGTYEQLRSDYAAFHFGTTSSDYTDESLIKFEWGKVPIYIAPIEADKDTWKRSKGIVLNATFRGCKALKESPAPYLEQMEKTNGELFQLNGTYWNGGISSISAGEFLKIHPKGWNWTFRGCSGIKTLPEEMLGGTFTIPGGAAFYGTFADCKSITQLPEKLYKEGTAAGTFAASRMFAKCTGLVNLPETFFAGCEEVLTDATNMFAFAFKATGSVRARAGLLGPLVAAAEENPAVIAGMFYGANLKYVDAELLQPFTGKKIAFEAWNAYELGTSVVSTSIFAGSALTSVPDGFLNGICGGLTDEKGTMHINTMYVFQGCSKLTSVPDDIFESMDWQYNIVNGKIQEPNSMLYFQYAFAGCTSLKHLPPLWEKYGTRIASAGSSYYAYTYDTFKGCTKANNYSVCPPWCKGVRNGDFRYKQYAKITKEEYDRIAELNKKNGYSG